MHPAGPGRPRNPTIDDAILSATRELLTRVGYKRLSFELIARRSGVTRPTIYRRWPSKAHVVHAAVFRVDEIGMADTGNFDHDLRAFITSLAQSLSLPVTRAAFPGLMADFWDDSSVGLEVAHDSWVAIRATFAERLVRAHACGQIATAENADRLLGVITGSMIQHVIALQEDTTGYVDFLADLVLDHLRPRP